MKYINKILIFIPLFLAGCANKSNEPVRIIYEFTLPSDEPHKVFIAYRDSTDYVTLYTDKNWTKEVRLSPNNVASLLIISQEDSDLITGNKNDKYILNKNDDLFSGRIIQKEKTIADYAESVISLSVIVSKTQE